MAYQFTQTGQELQYLIDRIYQIADEYDSSVSYTVGDYCSHEGHIYKCTAATTGTFDASKWTSSIFVMDTVKGLDTRLTTAEGDIDTAQEDISSINSILTTRGGSVTMKVAGTPHVVVRQFGNVVSIWGWINGLSITANTSIAICQLQDVSFPPDVVRFNGTVGSTAYTTGYTTYIGIETTGNIYIYSSGAGNTLYFAATYIANS